MSDYGIKLVWSGWGRGITDDTVIGFSDAMYERYTNRIHIGTRMLIYETKRHIFEYPHDGEEALIAEAEIVKTFAQMTTVKTITKEHPHAVGVKIVFERAVTTHVPRSRVCEIIKNAVFPQRCPGWYSLSEDTYMKLRNELLRK